MNYGDAQRLAAKIRRARERANSPDLPDSDRAWLGEMMAVWASGYLEAACRDTLKRYAASRADQRISRAVARRLDRLQNPRMDRLLSLVGEFDPAWKATLEAFASGEIGESVNSIVGLRNSVAHGGPSAPSVATISQHFEHARRLPQKLAELCGLATQEAEE